MNTDRNRQLNTVSTEDDISPKNLSWTQLIISQRCTFHKENDPSLFFQKHFNHFISFLCDNSPEPLPKESQLQLYYPIV